MHGNDQNWRHYCLWAAVVSVVLGVLACILLFPHRFILDDAYFYLVTARNLVTTGEHSFSGVMATNGVHPLWLYMVTGWSWLAAGLNKAWLWDVRTWLPLHFALVAVGAWACQLGGCGPAGGFYPWFSAVVYRSRSVVCGVWFAATGMGGLPSDLRRGSSVRLAVRIGGVGAP
ncbi:MAG: hypothetical protein EXR77_09790 [Myxococcales bacterium]|nr:hypothetical protein [Myxococcales bacterium]